MTKEKIVENFEAWLHDEAVLTKLKFEQMLEMYRQELSQGIVLPPAKAYEIHNMLDVKEIRNDATPTPITKDNLK